MKAFVRIDEVIFDQSLTGEGEEMSVGLHELAVSQLHMQFPKDRFGQGYVSADKPLDWIELRVPNPLYGLSKVGHESSKLHCEVISDIKVSLQCNPLALMDEKRQVEHLVEGGASQDMAEGVVESGLEPDILMNIGEHAALVFRGKEELVQFLNQCDELRKNLPA